MTPRIARPVTGLALAVVAGGGAAAVCTGIEVCSGLHAGGVAGRFVASAWAGGVAVGCEKSEVPCPPTGEVFGA